VFYRNSGGGVTLSGGEVTVQSAFAVRLLDALREEGIHTAIETCGFAKPEIFDRVARAADLVLFDMKHSDPEKHEFFTGVDNVLIGENLKRTVRSGKRVIARYPLIPGVNDDEKTVNETGDLCMELGIDTVHILPFHQAGETKWDGIGVEYSFSGLEGMAVKDAESAKAILEEKGLIVSLGGSGK
jgi:pyruvate formate lyase activating enzyme